MMIYLSESLIHIPYFLKESDRKNDHLFLLTRYKMVFAFDNDQLRSVAVSFDISFTAVHRHNCVLAAVDEPYGAGVVLDVRLCKSTDKICIYFVSS